MQRCPHFRNRGVPLYAEVSSFQGVEKKNSTVYQGVGIEEFHCVLISMVGIDEFHCIQRCPHFRGLE